MAEIIAKNINVQFPVFDSHNRSLRHALVLNRLAKKISPDKESNVGGSISLNSHDQVVISALDDLSFTMKDGDRVGIIGHNGAGKTTLLRVLCEIYIPQSGNLTVDGAQTPMFALNDGIDPEATGFEAIRSRGIMLGLSPAVIKASINDIVEFTELGDYLDMPVRTYSTGMMVRLVFAVATAIKPEILLMDEIIGAGDASFIEKAEVRLKTFVDSANIMVVATHSMDIVRTWCNKAMLLHKGKIAEYGDVEKVISAYHSVMAG